LKIYAVQLISIGPLLLQILIFFHVSPSDCCACLQAAVDSTQSFLLLISRIGIAKNYIYKTNVFFTTSQVLILSKTWEF